MVRKTNRRGKRFLVIDFSFTKPDGTEGRYRRDAAVQIMAAAQTEEAGRKLGATLFGDPEIIVDKNGVPLRAKAAEIKPPPEPTFADVAKRYLAEYAPSALEYSTRDSYESKLRSCLLPHLGKLLMSEAVEVSKSREIDVIMLERGSKVSTRANTFLALRSVVRFALEAKILEKPPLLLALPKRIKRVPVAPSVVDVATCIDATTCDEHRATMLLAAHGGLRRGEIRALRCGDVDFDRNRLIVRLSRYREVTGSTKGRKERIVPLSPQLRAALLATGVDTRPRDQEAALSSWRKPWGQDGIWAMLQATFRRCELPRHRLHALRAYFVTALLNGHVPVHVVSALAGHEDLATTQKYAEVLNADKGVAVGVLGRAHEAGQEGRDAKLTPEPPRAMERRVKHSKARGSLLRSRALGRARQRGNTLETDPIAAE
jgi:integrase/recombinase XerD